MNCTDYQHDIILLHTGELPAVREADLERHCQICSACARYHHQVQEAASAIRNGRLPVRDVDLWPRVQRTMYRPRYALPIPKWVAAPAFSLLLISALISTSFFKLPGVMPRAEQEIVKDLQFLTDYELCEDLEVLENGDFAS